jgi:hypothetical protein
VSSYTLSFLLPPEIHELYRWRNGTSIDEFKDEYSRLFYVDPGCRSSAGFDFLPLQVIVDFNISKMKLYNLH